MDGLADSLSDLDAEIVRAVAELRWGPLTEVMLVASTWWVRSVLFVAIGLVADIRSGRRVPLCALSAGLAFAVASPLTTLVKELVERGRPALGEQAAALVAIPTTPSLPSGHASTAFAGATAVLLWSRWLGLPALAVATVVAFSRVYLGVHYPLDVLAGAALGAAAGYVAVRLVRAVVARLAIERRAAPRPRAP